MSTSQTSFLSEIVSGGRIPVGKLAYFRQRLRNRFYELVVAEFLRQSSGNKLTKAEVSRRIRSRPSQVTRWLSAPGNWEIDTISDLLLAMGAEPGEFTIRHLRDEASRNYRGPDWIHDPNDYRWIENNQRQMQRPLLSPSDAQAIFAGLTISRKHQHESDGDHRKPIHPLIPVRSTRDPR